MKRFLKLAGILILLAALLCSCSRDVVTNKTILDIAVDENAQRLYDTGLFTQANLSLHVLNPYFPEGIVLDSFYIDGIQGVFLFRLPEEPVSKSVFWQVEINGNTELADSSIKNGYAVWRYWMEPVESVKIQYGRGGTYYEEGVLDLSFLLQHTHPRTVDLELNEAIPYGAQGQYQDRLLRLQASENFAAIEYERDLKADQKINNIHFQLMNQESDIAHGGPGLFDDDTGIARIVFGKIPFTEEMTLVAVDQEGTEVYRRPFHPLQTS